MSTANRKFEPGAGREDTPRSLVVLAVLVILGIAGTGIFVVFSLI
jgi:hypothetical protein